MRFKNFTDKEVEMLIKYKRMVTDKDKLLPGPCIVAIAEKYGNGFRFAEGSVSRVPYKKSATKKTRQKYGDNLVYVLYRDSEEILGYYQ